MVSRPATAAHPPFIPSPATPSEEKVAPPLSRRTRGLILVGHGSHLNADSSAPVYAHAAAIRATGAFDEVHEAFWKEEPALTSVFDLAETDDVIIVPLFLSEGYFTREVLPREIGLTGPVTDRNGRSFRYLPPVGTHPAMTGMILQRARSVLGGDPKRERQATLVVIGHGTERNATSADTVYSLVAGLRKSGDFGAVTCGFLDEAPRIGEVIAGISTPEVVLVPFFVAEGWHTRETIPAELGLEGAVTRKGEQTLWYTPPVGTLPEMAGVILEMADDPGAEAGLVSSEKGPGGLTDVAEPSSARSAFFAHVRGLSGPLYLMDVVVQRAAEGRYRLSHQGDAAADPATLTVNHDPESALEIARFRNDGSYRAMRSSADLRTGWIFPALDENELWRALSRLYPAALQDWLQGAERIDRAAGYRSWSSRQTAMYADVRKLDFSGVQQVVQTLCASCHRERCWVNDAEGSTAAAGDTGTTPGPEAVKARPEDAEASRLSIPCREPCTLFATRAREVARE